MTGLVVQATGSFVPALVVGAAIGVLSACAYLFVVQDPITAGDMDALVPAPLPSARLAG